MIGFYVFMFMCKVILMSNVEMFTDFDEMSCWLFSVEFAIFVEINRYSEDNQEESSSIYTNNTIPFDCVTVLRLKPNSVVIHYMWVPAPVLYPL